MFSMLYHVIPQEKQFQILLFFIALNHILLILDPPPNPIPDGDMMGAPGEDDSIHVAKKKAAEDLANKMQEKQKKKEADE